MAAFNKFNSFTEALAEKVHNLGADTLKLLLTNTAPVATNTVRTDITQIAGGSGYTTGGNTITTTSSSQSAGVYKLVLADLVITATGGNVGPFRYVVICNETAANDELIGWYDYGSSITLADTETLTVDFDATNGVLQV